MEEGLPVTYLVPHPSVTDSLEPSQTLRPGYARLPVPLLYQAPRYMLSLILHLLLPHTPYTAISCFRCPALAGGTVHWQPSLQRRHHWGAAAVTPTAGRSAYITESLSQPGTSSTAEHIPSTPP